MECGTECWDGILGQEGQQWCLTLQHPMAISSWGGGTWAEAKLGQELLLCSCLEPGAGPRWGAGDCVDRFGSTSGLELAGPFRVSLSDVCLLSPQFNMPICVINPEAGRDQPEVELASL